MTTTVLLQFGDGSHKEIEVEADDPEEAVEEAKDWLRDGAWLEVQDEQGRNLASDNLR